MKKLTLLFAFLLSACTVPVDAPPDPTALPTGTAPSTSSPAETFTSIPVLTSTPAAVETVPVSFCDDSRRRDLIGSLQTAVQTKDGALLSSLVSPSEGMDVMYIRDGNIVNYDVEHAKFVFETTFQADWGLGAGSGEEVIGSFQELILPSLQLVFTPSAEVTCNELKTGGVTYVSQYPYPGAPFYSVHFPGTDQYSGLDWETWAVGMTPVGEEPYLTALIHFEWEP